MTKRFLLLLSACLLLAACQTPSIPSLSERSKDNKLRDTLNSYEVAIRWGAVDRAYGFLTPELSEQTEIPTGLGNFRVTGYDRIDGPRELPEDRATQTVVIEYVEKDRQVVHTLTDRQIWQWKDEEGVWLRANPIPSF